MELSYTRVHLNLIIDHSFFIKNCSAYIIVHLILIKTVRTTFGQFEKNQYSKVRKTVTLAKFSAFQPGREAQNNYEGIKKQKVIKAKYVFSVKFLFNL